ncbi:MAG: DUF4248 domain-containing protein [Paludibacter sp.]|nr:DUF4248 domain-containing protein [Bacteroidales bacterium]MCM1069072.1 DUF4248 domain-containing protein [Prevotella sp.]MCM1353511.1 DUF4248 domain-containing protein [Bacteroides sp.]MCM1442672.1 DUF4248 domain-containing protein [Muribaculum sp.]MCM1481692.1 DUF4248 domain-containing protein [Paludibacter sp.]
MDNRIHAGKERAYLKSELARKAGVSTKTFSRWLKADAEVLRSMGVSPHAHILPPHIVKYIRDKYAF